MVTVLGVIDALIALAIATALGGATAMEGVGGTGTRYWLSGVTVLPWHVSLVFERFI